MDLHLAILSAALRDGASGLDALNAHGINGTSLFGESKKVYEFILEHNEKYKEIPSLPVIYNKLDITVPEVKEPLSFFIDEFKNVNLYNHIQDGLLKAATEQQLSRDPQKTMQILEDIVLQGRGLYSFNTGVEDLSDVSNDAMSLYERFERKESGITTPWADLNRVSSGFWGQDIIVFAARNGLGKTWLMLIQAIHAVNALNKRVIFVSPEMPRERLALRTGAIIERLDYDKVLTGKLSPDEKMRLRRAMMMSNANKNWGIVSSKKFDFKTSSLANLVKKHKADVVYVDGMYLLQSEGANRFDQAAKTTDDLKKQAIQFEIPYILSTQFNKEVDTTKEETVTGKGVALTDVLNWHASMMFGLFQDKEMKIARMLELKQLKSREGVGTSVKIWWDFHTMNFSQIAKDKPPEKLTNFADDPFAQQAVVIDDRDDSVYDENAELPF